MTRAKLPKAWMEWTFDQRMEKVLAEMARLAPENGRPLSRRQWERRKGEEFPTARHVISSLGAPWAKLAEDGEVKAGKEQSDFCDCGEPATQVRRFRLGGPEQTNWGRWGQLCLCDQCAKEFDELEEESKW